MRIAKHVLIEAWEKEGVSLAKLLRIAKPVSGVPISILRVSLAKLLRIAKQ